MGADRNRGSTLCLLGFGALFISTLLAYRPPPPPQHAAPSAFSAYRAKAQLQSLVGNGLAHPIGSADNARMRGAILLRLSQLGYDTQVQSGFICNEYTDCGVASNIIARLHPSASEGDAVLLAAHYDSVAAGPGASDNAAGVATVLEIARILKATPPTRHPVVLLLSDGEEAGLLGAHLFVRDHPLATHIRAAVSLDARGSSGPSLMFETGSANSWLMSLYRRAIARPITDSVFYVVYKTLHNDSDFSVFKSAGWQGFNFAFIGDVGHYHTALDTVANADLRSIQHQGDNALASVLVLANSDRLHSPPLGDAVYFDVLARTLITWPGRLSILAASATLILVLSEAALLCRLRRVSIRQIVWGCIGVGTSLSIASVASGVILILLLLLGKVPPLQQYSWIAHPAWMNGVCATVAGGACGISSLWLARRASFWGFWVAAVLLMAIGALVQAALSPGLSFLALLTAATAVIAVIPSIGTNSAAGRLANWTADGAALAPAWMLFALMMPFLAHLYGAIGSIAWPIDTLLLSLSATLLLPSLATATARLRRGIVMLCVALSVVGVFITCLVPTYSQSWPQRVNFSYEADADKHLAFWVTHADSMRLPAAIANAAAFEKYPKPRYPGSWIRGFYAAAPWKPLPAPLLRLRAATRRSEEITRYEVHLQSMRGAPEMDVAFPRLANIRDIIVTEAGAERRIPLYEAQDGSTRLHVVGLAQPGLDFAVDVHGDSLEARLSDQSYSLPGGEFLQRLRSPQASISQDGDTTVVQHTVMLDPTAGL